MEEQELSKNNFDSKQWLENQLQAKQNSGQTLELQMTELLFNIKQIQNSTEEQVLQAKQQLENSEENVIDSAEKTLDSFMNIKQFLDQNLEDDKLDQFSRVNEDLFNEINEMTTFKQKLQNSMDILNGILQIDFYIEEIQKCIEDKNILQIETILIEIQETLLILFQLPKINPRYEKAERLINMILRFTENFVTDNFQNKEKQKIDKEICQIYKICKIINKEQYFIDLYKNIRLSTDFTKEQITKSNQKTDKFQQQQLQQDVTLNYTSYLENTMELIKKEKDYLQNFQIYNDDKQIYSKLLCLYITQIFEILKELITPKYFENPSCQAIFQFHNIYLGFLNFIEELGNKNNLIIDSDIINLREVIYKPFIKFTKRQTLNEQQHVSQQFQKILKNYQITTQNSSADEKFAEFDFLKLLDIYQTSFKRIFEISFGVELEEWKQEFEKDLKDYFQKLERQLNLIQNEFSLIDQNFEQIFSQSQASQQQFKMENKTTVNLKQNLSLLQILIGKFQEIIYFQDELLKFDKIVKDTIYFNNNNSSQGFTQIFQNVQKYLLSQNQDKKRERQMIIINIKNNENFFEQSFNVIKLCLDKIRQLIMKIMLSESYNEFSSMFNQMVEKYSCNDVQDIEETDYDSSQNICMSAICQNFFMHIQMLEEVNVTIKQNSSLFHHLKDIDQEQQQSILESCYNSNLRSHPFLKYKLQEFSDKDYYGFIKYWTFFYTFFLAKIYNVYQKSILKTIKTDFQNTQGFLQENIKNIEHFLNVFNNFAETCSTIGNLEQNLNDYNQKLKLLQSQQKADEENEPKAQISIM